MFFSQGWSPRHLHVGLIFSRDYFRLFHRQHILIETEIVSKGIHKRFVQKAQKTRNLRLTFFKSLIFETVDKFTYPGD